MLRPLLAALLFILAMAPLPASAELDDGWWVIVATYPLTPPERQQGDVERTEALAARCHAETFNDFSAKFKGFAPGYNVFVVGAFATRGEADRKLATLRPCFPDAYVKRARYLGE